MVFLLIFSRSARVNEQDYINIINQSGCWSLVGRQGGKQDISLASIGCLYRSTIKHEIIHSLGYYHEQSRLDRDNFVKINFANVKSSHKYNFDWTQNTETFGVPYDGRSTCITVIKIFQKMACPPLKQR